MNITAKLNLLFKHKLEIILPCVDPSKITHYLIDYDYDFKTTNKKENNSVERKCDHIAARQVEEHKAANLAAGREIILQSVSIQVSEGDMPS